MCDNGKCFFSFYEINYNNFELHYSLLKEPKLQENSKHIKQNEMQKREQKVKLRNGLSLCFYYRVFRRHASTLTTNLVCFFFASKFFYFFSLN